LKFRIILFVQRSVELELNPKPKRALDSIILKTKTIHIIDVSWVSLDSKNRYQAIKNIDTKTCLVMTV